MNELNISNCSSSVFGNIELPSDELSEINTSGFNYRIADGVFLYGLIEGYGNVKSSLYFIEKLLFKIYSNFDMLMSDIEIKNLLYQTFLSIESSLISDLETDTVEFKKSGLAVIVILLVKNRLFIANTGSNIGLLCRVDDNDIYHIDKLNADHSLNAAEEFGRLSSLGINLDEFKLLAKEICPLNSLRIIGDSCLKLNYKYHDILSKLSSSPWSASPQVVGPVNSDETSQILVLISSGLFEVFSLQSDIADVNKYLCNHILMHLGVHKQVDEAFKFLKQDIISNLKQQCLKNTVPPNSVRSTGLLFCCLNKDLIGKKVFEGEKMAFKPTLNNRPKALTIEIPSPHDLSHNLIDWRPFCDKLTLDTDILTKTATEISMTTSTGTDESSVFHKVPPQLDDKGQTDSYIDFSDYYSFIAEKFHSNNSGLEEYFYPFV